MSEKPEHNKYTLGIVIAIIVASIFVIYFFKPSSIEVFGVKIKIEEKNIVSETSSQKLEGDWEMSFDFKRCSNPEFANKEFKCFYNIRLNQDGNTISGTGNKHSESFNGSITKYSREFPIKIKGEIKDDKLIAKLYELNSFEEVTGVIEVPLDKAFTYNGIYKASGENCDGNILLKRILPKPRGN